MFISNFCKEKGVVCLLFFIILLLVTMNVYAATYNLIMSHVGYSQAGDLLYESNDGIIIKTPSDCNLSTYQQVSLHYYGNPYPSSNGSAYVDSITFSREVPEVEYNSVYDLNGNYVEYEALTGNIVTQELACYVKGTMGLEYVGSVSTTHDAVFESVSQILYLRNVKVFDGIYDSHKTYDTVDLEMVKAGEVVDTEYVFRIKDYQPK